MDTSFSHYGPANLVAGMIQMDGGSIAFPDQTDREAQRDHVHLLATIKGAKYSFHVSVGEVDGRKVKFLVPHCSDEVIVLGLIKRGFDIEIVELTSELMGSATAFGGIVELIIDAAKSKLRKIRSFKARL